MHKEDGSDGEMWPQNNLKTRLKTPWAQRTLRKALQSKAKQRKKKKKKRTTASGCALREECMDSHASQPSACCARMCARSGSTR